MSFLIPSPGPGGGYDWSLPGLWPLEVTNGLDSHSRPEVDSLLYDFHVRCILSADVLPTLTTLIHKEESSTDMIRLRRDPDGAVLLQVGMGDHFTQSYTVHADSVIEKSSP